MRQSSSLAGDDAGIERQRLGIAAQLAAGLAQIGEDRRQHRAGAARSTRSVSVAPQIETRRILALSTIARALSGSAARVDIGVAEPFEMGDDRDAALALHPLDQRASRRAAR